MRDSKWMKKLYKKYFSLLLLSQKKNVMGQISFIFLGSLVTTAIPVIHQIIINNIFDSKQFSLFFAFIIIMFILYLLQCCFSLLHDFFQAKVEANIKYQLRDQLNIIISKKKYEEYLKVGNEKVVSRYNNDTNVIANHLSSDVFDLLEQVLILLLAVYMICRISIALLLCMILILLLYYVVNKKIGHILQSAIKKLFTFREESLGCFTENYNNNFLVKIYNLYSWIEKRFQTVYKNEYKQKIKTDMIYSANINITKFIVNSLIVCSWIFGGYYLKNGQGNIGDVVALTEYVGLVVSPFFYFSQFNNKLQEAKTSIKRMDEEFISPSEELDEGKSLSEISDIKIDDLKFNYKPEGFALHIKFLNMKKGEIIGLKGESGSGKTTIVNLLMQLYLVDHGNIYINGIDWREFRIRDIRNKIGYVSQKSYFFEDTIRENLFGDYPLEEIELLASKLDIQEDIKRMENSYGYVLKKNGSNISGGQQKRIDILRVLLAEKDVLIFDEATANLDRKRRDDFFNVIMELKKEKIIIMITHNDLELNFFDKIYNV